MVKFVKLVSMFVSLEQKLFFICSIIETIVPLLLLFYNLDELQENRRNENCEEKVIQFCEVELEMSNARNQLAIE